MGHCCRDTDGGTGVGLGYQISRNDCTMDNFVKHDVYIVSNENTYMC